MECIICFEDTDLKATVRRYFCCMHIVCKTCYLQMLNKDCCPYRCCTKPNVEKNMNNLYEYFS